MDQNSVAFANVRKAVKRICIYQNMAFVFNIFPKLHIYLFIYLFILFIYLSIYLFMYLFIYYLLVLYLLNSILEFGSEGGKTRSG